MLDVLNLLWFYKLVKGVHKQLTQKDTNEHLQNIKKMYDKLTYYDHYGGTLILFIVITIVVKTFWV